MTRSTNSNTMDQSKQENAPRELVFSKMEQLIREMQHPETGVPVRSQKQFLTSIPCAFTVGCCLLRRNQSIKLNNIHWRSLKKTNGQKIVQIKVTY
ncbi:regulator of G-protein signaling 9-like [Tachypleus tridentatus]|uniref:regulator of G-protein signaling 9-like n=1 Tax=Tachypleus tridentatus TaxID=6853 RepID=UPI003FD4D2F1